VESRCAAALPQRAPQAPAARGKALDAKALEAGFQKYKAEHVEAIQADGVSRFCEDLGVDPGDVAVLLIAYHFKAERMFEFSKAEWLQGMTALGVDTVPKLAALLGTLRSSLSSADTFRDVYAYAFAFGLERGAKVLVADTAVGLWSILLPGRWHAADAWMAYVSALPALKVVSKDTWMQTLEFIRTIKPDLSNFDENAAWCAEAAHSAVFDLRCLQADAARRLCRLAKGGGAAGIGTALRTRLTWRE